MGIGKRRKIYSFWRQTRVQNGYQIKGRDNLYQTHTFPLLAKGKSKIFRGFSVDFKTCQNVPVHAILNKYCELSLKHV